VCACGGGDFYTHYYFGETAKKKVSVVKNNWIWKNFLLFCDRATVPLNRQSQKLVERTGDP
jgi:hypothetical protein